MCLCWCVLWVSLVVCGVFGMIVRVMLGGRLRIWWLCVRFCLRLSMIMVSSGGCW